MAIDYTKIHHPCGHWHKRVTLPGIGFETYFELLTGSMSQPDLRTPYHALDYILCSSSFLPINSNDFDGDVSWYFEVIANNIEEFDITLKVVDTDDNMCATVVIPSGTVGDTGYELQRFRVEMTPTVTDDVGMYGLRLEKPEGEEYKIEPYDYWDEWGWHPDCFITTARIIVRQSGASKTKIQIPLFACYYAYELQNYYNEPYDYPIGWGLYDPITPDDISSDRDTYSWATIWKFLSGELDQVSKAVFSAAITSGFSSSKKTITVFATMDFQHFHWMLYTADDYVSAEYGFPYWTDEYTSHVGNGSGKTFTPIPDSLIYWPGTPTPYFYTSYPDLSGLQTGLNYIFLGGEWYYGLAPEDQWGHWDTWFTINLSAGFEIQNAVFTAAYVDGNHVKLTLTYETVPTNYEIMVCLYDITADEIVEGTQLTWTEGGFERKFIEFSTSKLVNDHEYRMGIDNTISGFEYYAELIDAELLLNIDPISKLTTWSRCMHSFEGESDNWYVPDAWGEDYYSGSQGANCIASRVLMYLPDPTIEIFLEASRAAYLVDPGESDIYLEDFGDGVAETIISGENGEDVANSEINWDTETEYVPNRRRSLSLTVTANHEYGVRNLLANYGHTPSNGFIVKRIR